MRDQDFINLDHISAVIEFIASRDQGQKPTDERLHVLARLTAAKYWRTPVEWPEVTMIFRPKTKVMYAVFPIYRGRYYAAVSVHLDDVGPPLLSEDVHVVAITILEDDAFSLACAEMREES